MPPHNWDCMCCLWGYPSGLIGSGTITQAWGGRGWLVENEARDFCKTLRQYFIGVGSHGVNQQLKRFFIKKLVKKFHLFFLISVTELLNCTAVSSGRGVKKARAAG